MILEFQIFFGFFAFLFLAILISNIIKKKRTKKQRSASLMRCHYCGEPMLESDVFCENCWKITPKVQEMLNNHPDRKPEFYSNLSYKGHNHCPHCKAFYCYSRHYYDNLDHGTPIKCCTNCHQYFLDSWYFEWSVCAPFLKFKEFFSFFLWFSTVLIILLLTPLLFDLHLLLNWWEVIVLIIIFTVPHSIFCFIRHKTIRKKAIRESHMRLGQNPEYPQILINMDYITMIDEKYDHLNQIPTHSLKDQLKEFKEFLIDAFTFD